MCILLAIKDVDWRKRLCFLTPTFARANIDGVVGSCGADGGTRPTTSRLVDFFIPPQFSRRQDAKYSSSFLREHLLRRLLIDVMLIDFRSRDRVRSRSWNQAEIRLRSKAKFGTLVCLWSFPARLVESWGWMSVGFLRSIPLQQLSSNATEWFFFSFFEGV